MIQRGNRLRLLLEPPHPLRIARKRRWQNLHRHITIQPRIARPIHLAHPASACWCHDLVRTEFGARGDRHLCRAIIAFAALAMIAPKLEGWPKITGPNLFGPVWPVIFGFTGPICARALKSFHLLESRLRGHHDWPVKPTIRELKCVVAPLDILVEALYRHLECLLKNKENASGYCK